MIVDWVAARSFGHCGAGMQCSGHHSVLGSSTDVFAPSWVL